MADEVISPNMLLPVPVPGVAPGPQWATDYYNCLNIIDAHDHSANSGVQITPSGLNINADLPFNNSNATSLRTSRYQVQTAAPALTTDKGCIYVLGVDLYFRDVSGNYIRLTQSGGIAGSPGSIANLVAPASATYVAASQTFVWQSDSLTAANMDCGSIILRNLTASSNGLTLAPPSSLSSNYTITLPSLPASTKMMRLDTSGNVTASLDVDNSTLQISTNTLQIKASGVGTTQIADLAVTTAKINDLAVTTGKIALLAVDTGTLAASAVTTAKIADSAVTNGKIADAAVATTKLSDLAVTTAKINDLAVTTLKLADSNVTTAKLADSNVTTAKIADSNVTTAKIADTAVTVSKLAAMPVSTSTASLGGIMATGSCGTFNTVSTSFTTVLSGTIVVTGNRPIKIMAVAAQQTANPGAYFGGIGGVIPYVLARRSGGGGGTVDLGQYNPQNQGTLPTGALAWVDVSPPAGTLTYELMLRSSNGLTVSMVEYRFIVYEL